MKKNNQDFFSTRGEIIERINKKKFRVKCDNGKVVEADVPARFRTKEGRRRTMLVVEDKVVVEIPLGDLGKGYIVSLIEENT